MQKEIKQTWHFNQSPQEVWEYLTKPELNEQWLMKNDFRPVVGHKFCFSHSVSGKNAYSGIINCEVLEVIPFSRLSNAWNGGMKDGSRNYNSVVSWTLVPNENGTELQLQHDGFTMLEDITAHTSGWNSCVNKMAAQLNTSAHANTSA